MRTYLIFVAFNLLLLHWSVLSLQVVCYYTNWSTYRQGNGQFNPENVNPNLCTQIVYAFAVLDESTYLMKSHDPSLDIDRGFYKKIVGLKESNKNLQILLAIGGWNDSQGSNKYSNLVRDVQRRANFIQNAIKFLQEYGFDGLDLDWEYPAVSDKENFATFVRELKTAFKPLNLLVTAAIGAAKWRIDESYDIQKLGQDLDQINIMAYDLKGSWDGRTGHHAPIYSEDGLSDDGAVEYLISLGVPKEKLILGMPLYGRTWTLANSNENVLGSPTIGGGQEGEYTKERGFLAYYEICSMSWTRIVRDPNGEMGPYAYKDQLWTSFDDPAILRMKVEYLKSKGLGGAMVWDLSLDDFNNNFCNAGSYPLMTAINKAIGNSGSNTQTTTTKETTIGTLSTTTVKTTVSQSPGSCSVNGDYHYYPGDCSKFYKCDQGKLVAFNCPSGLHFSKSCNCCNWPNLSDCR